MIIHPSRFGIALLILAGALSGSLACQGSDKTYELKQVSTDSYTVSLMIYDQQEQATKSAPEGRSLAPSRHQQYFFQICHNISQSCTNALRSAPLSDAPNGKGLLFRVVELEDAYQEIDQSVQKQQLASLRQQLAYLDSVADVYERELRDGLDRQIREGKVSPEIKQVLSPYVDQKALLRHKAIQQKAHDLATSGMTAGSVFSVSLIPQFLYFLGRPGSTPLLSFVKAAAQTAMIVSVAWAGLYGMAQIDNDHIYQQTLNSQQQRIRQDFHQIFSELYGEEITSFQGSVIKQRSKTDARIRKASQALDQGKQQRFSLLYEYLPTLTQIHAAEPVVVAEGSEQQMNLLLSQLGQLMEQVMRHYLELNDQHEELSSFEGKAIVGQFCLPAKDGGESKASCQEISHLGGMEQEPSLISPEPEIEEIEEIEEEESPS